MSLETYSAKRNFKRTREPSGAKRKRRSRLPIFVVQRHDARRLHYDFRLEMDGVLKSWAVPKGPSTNPADKRLAVHVEDHPLDYAKFEGEIPKGQYGAGTVEIWDRGTWEAEGDAEKAYGKGDLKFTLHGDKLAGTWVLVRMQGKRRERERGKENWLLIKKSDEHASTKDVLRESAGRKKKKKKKKSKSRLAAADVEGARRAKLPEKFAPQLATLRSKVPESDDWLHEVKYDGYRLIARKTSRSVHLLSRNGKDWTSRLPSLAKAIGQLDVKSAILDGELVALTNGGISDFQTLQNALHEKDTSRLVFFAFDLPFADGKDLRKAALADRKEALAGLLDSPGIVRYSDHVEGRGEAFLTQACKAGLEGIVSKRRQAHYASRRTADWLKIKCSQRQEFVIGGFTDPQGSRTGFGALLLGYYDDQGKLIYSGRVGTGFTDTTLKSMSAKLDKLETDKSPFKNPPRGREIHWCRPELVGEVRFSGWTRDGHLRHPSFEGLREDKPPRQIGRERPVEERSRANGATKAASQKTGREKRDVPGKARSRARGVVVAGVRLSNPDRVIFPEHGATKQDLAEYYERIADWIMPHVEGRPLSIVRCPRGSGEDCFYQKHLNETLPRAVHGVKIREKSKVKTYISIDDLRGLVTLVQFGTLEVHPWASRAKSLEKPDYVVFDLDPAPDVAWTRVIDAARHMREQLAVLDLDSYVRTSGGKGLHVVVPIAPRHDWEEVREFAKIFAQGIAATNPRSYVATMSKAKRGGKIFIDHFRNARGATSIANYSSRAKPGAPVAVPLRWDELAGLESSTAYDLDSLPKRLSGLKADPWAGFLKARQRLPRPKK
ncbi:MAG: DNA ligase D [Gammaproteobacteria bacterium]